ncbi:MAG: RNA polymerase subunit sigma-24, partial [Caulobacter sp.]|nr:RNA polymerase subunit sigma-24 [Caulobacter sp.]
MSAPPADPAPARPDLGAWMAVHGPRLRRYFARRAPRADAEDLVQDVFLRVQAAQLETPIVEVE